MVAHVRARTKIAAKMLAAMFQGQGADQGQAHDQRPDHEAGVAEHGVKIGHEPLRNEHQRDVREDQDGIDGFKEVSVIAGLYEQYQIPDGNAYEEQEQHERDELLRHDVPHLFFWIGDIILMGTELIIKTEANEDDQRAQPRRGDVHHRLDA